MTRSFLIMLSCFLFSNLQAQEASQISYLKTFTQAYGYVKYFHPSDEAAEVDWNTFAAYGAQEVTQCENPAELVQTLNNLFTPLAPGIVFSSTAAAYDLSSITPANTAAYQPTYWQHRGVSKDMNYQNYVYESVRVNRYAEIDEASGFGNLLASIDPKMYLGKALKYTAWVKLAEGFEGTGHLWLRIDKSDKSLGFFENMGANPIRSTEWQQYEIIGTVDELAANILFGCFMNGKGTLLIDDVQLAYQEQEEWIAIPLENNGFEADQIGTENEKSVWSGKGEGYSFTLSDTDYKAGKQAAVITYEGKISRVRGETIFDAHPQFGELVEREIGKDIYCQIPLNLYTTEEATYPKSNTYPQLSVELEEAVYDDNSLALHLGNVVNLYNVFQHFYPYFDQVAVDWDAELEKALKRSFTDKRKEDHLITLQKMTAPLKDGHIRVWQGESTPYSLPIEWEWIEGQLVITDVFDEDLAIERGSIVTQINQQPAEDFFVEINSRISAGTAGWLAYRAQSLSTKGKEGEEMLITIDGIVIPLKFEKKYNYTDGEIAIQKYDHTVLDGGIHYLNLGTIEMDTINALLPELATANGIICDMRGYPNGNHDLIAHLLAEKDTSTAWMRVPQIIYPDQKKLVGYEHHGWEIEPKAPYLGDKKIVFIIDGRAISYAESYMSFIEGYQLATIVGQPTAGTNGNVNPFDLLGGYSLSWTGMKVFKHDGSQHHGIGILPDIYVNKTIAGVRAGKDEFLEKAIEVILE
ncbi:MAG: S41 family peptidase [Bacteroidota bacterium]